MPGIHAPFSGEKATPLLCPKIINHMKKVYSYPLPFVDPLGEKARITAAGGFVDFGRVNGMLIILPPS